MIIKKSIKNLKKYLETERGIIRKKIAFIPTMGALHEGHLSLIKQAKYKGYYIIVSIYVNPIQFSPNEDLSKYPRTLRTDLEKLKQISVDLVFTPTTKDMSDYVIVVEAAYYLMSQLKSGETVGCCPPTEEKTEG